MTYVIKELTVETWPLFEALANKHHGVWGGCWCTWFHQSDLLKRGDAATNKALKLRLVNEGKTHAALVCTAIDDSAVAWCQYGTPEELPAIYHRKEVETEDYQMPDWRITCIFVDKNFRKQGLARLALEGALLLMTQKGGGIVESYPQNTQGKKISSSFLYNGTESLFSTCGFTWVNKKGKNHTIMRKSL